MHSPIRQEYPAEGSRELVERKLRRLDRRSHPPTASSGDILRLLGEVSPSRIAAILALKPELRDLELAALWGQGDGDIAARAGHPLTGKAAAIVDIVRPDWEELEDER